MNQVVIDIWPMVVTALLTAVGTYVGFILRLRIKVAAMEERVTKVEEEVKRVDRRVDKKSEQFDKIQKNLSVIREEIVRIATFLDMNKKD